MPIDFQAAAVLPEIVLTVGLCAVLVLDLFPGPGRRRNAMRLSALTLAATLMAMVPIAGSEITTLGGMFVVDSFAILLKALFCVAGLFVLALSYDYLKGEEIPEGEYYFMILASLLGMMSLASSRDLVAIFISLELVSAPAFVLAGLRKADPRSNEAALKFFIFGILSTAVMLFGMSLVYGLTGATNLHAIAAGLDVGEPMRSVGTLAVFFVVVGFGFKISAFPFQWWVPDTYEGAPTPVAAFLSVASKTAGFVGLIQIMFVAFSPLAGLWRPMIAAVAVLTMTFGNLVALQQRHIIRLLAYSSIGQAGYILLPLALISPANDSLNQAAFVASISYLLIYAFMEMGAFAVAMVNGRRGGGWFVQDYAGLFSRSPGIALAMTAFMLSLAGIPPFAGWAAKFFVFRAAIEGGSGLLAVAMAVNTVIALFYYVAVVRQIYFEPPGELPAGFQVPILSRSVISLAALALVVLGVLPELAARFAGAAVPSGVGGMVGALLGG